MSTMLILRGIAGYFAGRDWPHGALDEPSAVEYARRRGLTGYVLDVSGETGPGSRQTRMALDRLHADAEGDITALYGFSGGGYNIRHIVNALDTPAKNRIRLVVVLGAPQNDPHLYNGPWELIYRKDPPGGHMDGPRALLSEQVLVTKD